MIAHCCFYRSPHVPHGWDAGVLFAGTLKPLFCSDLFHQFGDCPAITTSGLIEPTRNAMRILRQGSLSGDMPCTRQTEGVLPSRAALQPRLLSVIHGSSYSGAGAGLLIDLAGVIKETFDLEAS